MESVGGPPGRFPVFPVPRQSFVFVERETTSLMNELETLKDDWTFIPVRSPGDVHKYKPREEIRVGLMALGNGFSRNDYDTLHGLAERDCRWIALLDPVSLSNGHVLKLIDEVCYDFHSIPLDPARLRAVMGHAYGMARLGQMTSSVHSGEHDTAEFDMVGSSPMMVEVFRSIRKVAGVDASVLITGESGTGKELVARAIHERSPRRKGPFITLNCGAIPHNLIQSELFGYEKGAFTGANQRKIGHIEAANKGTIMLDEIGDMPLELQVNLLRVLQMGKIQRVGSSSEIPVDVRIIAATHIDLEKACKEGRFREDLYYRLNVLKIRLPALKDRGEDIGLLAQYFFRKFSKDYGSRHLKGFTPTALKEMYNYAWPGNVRELINKIKSAVLMSDGPYIRPDDLGLVACRDFSLYSGKTLKEIRNNMEREILTAFLRKNRNNVSRTSQELGVTRTTFYNLLKKHGMGFDPNSQELT